MVNLLQYGANFKDFIKICMLELSMQLCSSLSNVKNIFLSKNNEFSEMLKKSYQWECKVCSAVLETLEKIQKGYFVCTKIRILQTFIC